MGSEIQKELLWDTKYSQRIVKPCNLNPPNTDRVHQIVEKGLAGNGLERDEILDLYNVDPYTPDSFYIMWAGRELQMKLCDGKAQVHAQIGLNATVCGNGCKFCSFATCNNVRHGSYELPKEDVVEYAKIYQEQGANLLLVLATAAYSFNKALDMVGSVREVIDPQMPLLVNFDDMTTEQTKQLKEAGANGAYHAVRMREGIDTNISVEHRFETIHALQDAGMTISTCVEPVGPEHTPEELVEATLRCMSYSPLSAGVGRRVNVPGTLVCDRGMIDDITNARNVAIYRLAAGKDPMLNCAAATSLSAAAGANLSWAEVGTNPRDAVERTEKGGRATNVDWCKRMFRAGGYEVLEGFSQGWILD